MPVNPNGDSIKTKQIIKTIADELELQAAKLIHPDVLEKCPDKAIASEVLYQLSIALNNTVSKIKDG